MNHESYLEIMRAKLRLWPNATEADLEEKAIRVMADAGYTVHLDRLTDHRFRVKVQRRQGRTYAYNEHTTSTSGYPVLAAYEKWVAFRELEAQVVS